MASEPVRVEVAGLSVSGLRTEATRPTAVAAIAHGAGAGMNHPFMTGVAGGLVSGGVSVLRFNFPYMEARRRAPDPPPVLVDTWKAVMQYSLAGSHGLPVVVGGKSLGGRIASMLAAAEGRDFSGAALVSSATRCMRSAGPVTSGMLISLESAGPCSSSRVRETDWRGSTL